MCWEFMNSFHDRQYLNTKLCYVYLEQRSLCLARSMLKLEQEDFFFYHHQPHSSSSFSYLNVIADIRFGQTRAESISQILSCSHHLRFGQMRAESIREMYSTKYTSLSFFTLPWNVMAPFLPSLILWKLAMSSSLPQRTLSPPEAIITFGSRLTLYAYPAILMLFGGCRIFVKMSFILPILLRC